MRPRHHRTAPLAIALAAAAALSTGCTPDTPQPGSNVIAVRVTPENPVVTGGTTLAFVATAILESGQAKEVTDSPGTTWESSNTAVLEVNADGTAEAQGAGEAYVTATVSGITSPAQRVTVASAPTPTPTPTPAPTADHVVISEVLYSATTDPGGEFIELHNPTASPVALDDWELMRDGGSTVYITFPAATTIAAGGYVVVCNTPATCGIGGAFDSANNTAFPGTTGEWIVLRDASMTQIDEMAYGTGDVGTTPSGWCASSDPAANATAGNSVQRKPVGADGDNCNDWISNVAATPLAPPP